MKIIRLLLILVFITTVFYSCEFVTRALVYPSDCLSCEIREGENVWENLPVWQQKACGAKVVKMRKYCEEEAKRRNATCICITYIRS